MKELTQQGDLEVEMNYESHKHSHNDVSQE